LVRRALRCQDRAQPEISYKADCPDLTRCPRLVSATSVDQSFLRLVGIDTP
jgi:hypothetical protein